MKLVNIFFRAQYKIKVIDCLLMMQDKKMELKLLKYYEFSTICKCHIFVLLSDNVQSKENINFCFFSKKFTICFYVIH